MSTQKQQHPATDVAYTPDYSEEERVDVGAALEFKCIETTAIEVQHQEADSEDEGTVFVAFRDDKLRGRLFMSADEAEWLSQQLSEAATKAAKVEK